MQTIIYNIPVKRVREIKRNFDYDKVIKVMFCFSLALFIFVVTLAAAMGSGNSVGASSLGFTSFLDSPVETITSIEHKPSLVQHRYTEMARLIEPVEEVKEVEAVEEVSEPVYQNSAEFVVTAYCACEKCCGKWAALQGETIVGAAGIPLVNGVSVAVDNSLFKFGTEFHDSEGNTYIAADTGSGVNGCHIDIYMNDHQSAREVGKYTKTLYW